MATGREAFRRRYKQSPAALHDKYFPLLMMLCADKAVELRVYARQYDVEFVPLGVFPRLMVRALHISSSSLMVPWRFGFIVDLVRPAPFPLVESLQKTEDFS